MRRLSALPALALALALSLPLSSAAPSAPSAPSALAAEPPPPAAPTPAAPTPAAPTTATPTWVFVGDSLTAGFGLAREEAYVAVLEGLLKERGRAARLINAGVSGDTSAGVRRRLSWVLRAAPEALFLCIGANDGMRGQPIEAMKENIRATVREAQGRGARVYLLGVRLPPNYGEEYERAFNAAFPALAEELKVPFLPFLLEGVAAEARLNLGDGIHPNAEGHRRLAAHVLSFLEERGDLAALPPAAPAAAPAAPQGAGR